GRRSEARGEGTAGRRPGVGGPAGRRPGVGGPAGRRPGVGGPAGRRPKTGGRGWQAISPYRPTTVTIPAATPIPPTEDRWRHGPNGRDPTSAGWLLRSPSSLVR